MQTLGHYELISPIGSGGMAEVWLARRGVGGSDLAKYVAVKRMAPGLAQQSAYREMFKAETEMSMALSHPNVVQVFDFGAEEGEAYIVMEWVDGVNLGSLLSRLQDMGRSLPAATAMFIVGELLRALHYSHTFRLNDDSVGVIHRDVSPQNLLLSVNGNVKLTDFGVARLVDENTSGTHPKGKLRYMAPEQLGGQGMDARLDLYAVGAIMYEMIMGEPLRNAELMDELYGQIINGGVPELPLAVPVEIRDLTISLLAPKKEDRIATASEALKKLRSWPGYTDARDELGELVQEAKKAAGDKTSEAIAKSRRLGSSSGVGRRAPEHPMKTQVMPSGHSPHQEGAGTWPSGVAGRNHTVPDGASAYGDEVMLAEPPKTQLPPWWLMGVAGTALASVLGMSVWFVLSSDEEHTGVNKTPVVNPGGAGSTPPAKPKKTPDLAVTETVSPESSTAAPKAAPAPLKPSVKPPVSRPPPQNLVKNPRPTTKKPPRRDRKPVSVEIRASGLRYAYVKINGKEVLAEPNIRLKLSPGSYPVMVRQSEDDPWRSFGKIKVESGQALVVRLRKTGNLSVGQAAK